MFILSRVNIATVAVAFWPMNQGGLLSDKLQEIHTSSSAHWTPHYLPGRLMIIGFIKAVSTMWWCRHCTVICRKAAVLLGLVMWACVTWLPGDNNQQTTAILPSSCLFCLMFMFFVYGQLIFHKPLFCQNSGVHFVLSKLHVKWDSCNLFASSFLQNTSLELQIMQTQTSNMKI